MDIPNSRASSLPYKEDLVEYFDNKRTLNNVKRVFPKLDLAMEYSKRDGGVPVFRVETRCKSFILKRFLAVGYDALWDIISATDPNELCYHEIIYGPIHMFLDVEYKRLYNPGICSDSDTVNKIRAAIKATFAKCLNIILLDEEMHGTVSSSHVKFSYHLLVDLSRSKKLMFDGSGTCKALAFELLNVAKSNSDFWLYPDGDKRDGCDTLSGFDIYDEPKPGKTQNLDHIDDTTTDIGADAASPNVIADSMDPNGKKQAKVVKSAIDIQPYGCRKSLRMTYSTKLDESDYRPLMPHSHNLPVPTTPPSKPDKSQWSKPRFLRTLAGYVAPLIQIRYLVSVRYQNSEETEENIQVPMFIKNTLVDRPSPLIGKNADIPIATNEMEIRGAYHQWFDKPTGENSSNKRAKNTTAMWTFADRLDDMKIPEFCRQIYDNVITRELGLTGSYSPVGYKSTQTVVFNATSRICPFVAKKGGRPHGGERTDVLPNGSVRTYKVSGNNQKLSIFLLDASCRRQCHSLRCKGDSESVIIPGKYVKHFVKYSDELDKTLPCVDPTLAGVMDMLL